MLFLRFMLILALKLSLLLLFDREKRSFRGPRRGSSWTWDIKSIITISLCCNDHYEVTLQNTDVLCDNDLNFAILQFLISQNFQLEFVDLLRQNC